MIKDVWSNAGGRLDLCFRKCGLMIKEVWTND